MEGGPLPIGLMINDDIWVLEQDFHAINAAKPASFRQGCSFQACLLVRVQAEAQQVFKGVEVAQTGRYVDWTPSILD